MKLGQQIASLDTLELSTLPRLWRFSPAGVVVFLGMVFFLTARAHGAIATEAWVQRFKAPSASAFATAIAVDSNANVFVTGFTTSVVGGSNDYTTINYSGSGMPLWTNRYDGPSNNDDRTAAIALDGNGNVFVTGYSHGGASSNDYATIAYSGEGIPLWTNRYDGLANSDDKAAAITVDSSGNVFVTGYSHGGATFRDCATIAYSSAGVPLWTNRYNGPGGFHDQAVAIAVDASGNVFVTGSSYGSDGYPDYVTLAYSNAGLPLWTNRLHGGGISYDEANALAVDSSGNVFVTGSLLLSGNFDYGTIAYSGAGVPLWTNRYDGPGNRVDQSLAIALDRNGNVFVTGNSDGVDNIPDYATIKYSGVGVPLWTNRYSGPGRFFDEAIAVAVDGNDNVFVTGSSYSQESRLDYATIAYSSAGVPLWTNRYNGPLNLDDRPFNRSCLAIGPDGAIHVTGISVGNTIGIFRNDIVTVKYVWRSEIDILPLSPGSSNVDLTFSGAPNSFWSIERALAITGPWTNLGTVSLGTSGATLFQDTNRPVAGAFYRGAQP